MWPVGAVSKITMSNAAPPGPAGATSRKSVKRSKAATSAVQGPAHLLLHDLHHLAGNDRADRRQRPVAVLLAVARSGSISIAHRFGTASIGVI